MNQAEFFDVFAQYLRLELPEARLDVIVHTAGHAHLEGHYGDVMFEVTHDEDDKARVQYLHVRGVYGDLLRYAEHDTTPPKTSFIITRNLRFIAASTATFVLNDLTRFFKPLFKARIRVKKESARREELANALRHACGSNFKSSNYGVDFWSKSPAYTLSGEIISPHKVNMNLTVNGDLAVEIAKLLHLADKGAL